MKCPVHHRAKENTSTRTLLCQRSTASFVQSEFSTGRRSASSLDFGYPLFSFRSPSSCLRLLLRLCARSILPSKCFQKAIPTPDVTNPVSVPSFFTVCRIFRSSLTLCNTSSFLTESVQLIFSVLLQHHISELTTLLLLYFPSVQVLAPHSYTSNRAHH